MHSLEATDFPPFFEGVNGHEPHPWQSRLAEQVLSDQAWPETIEMPTGTGKTALLDIAIFALAALPQVFPRRVVFVIDRRIVVDQVMKRALKIADAMEGSIAGASKGASSTSALLRVSQNLSEFAGSNLTESVEVPLGVAALRGGIPLDRTWTQRPDQPWIITTTVDQFGSRLLFRGYGTSRNARPIHAGLCGNDCLVILDEVHLSRPFVQTLRDATSDGKYDGLVSVNPSSGLPRRMQIVEMSATPPQGKDQAAFTYTNEELSKDGLFAQIVKAPKVVIPEPASGNADTHRWLPKKVLDILKENEPHEHSVGIIVNRVRAAREIHKYLKDDRNKGCGYDSVLLTGRMRPLDKVAVLDEAEERLNPEREQALLSEGEKPTITVATQAIEVGADFSFDALITEVSPIDSLKQRLGRLARRGTPPSEDGRVARCWVVGSDKALSKPDFVYGDSARFTWEHLLVQSNVEKSNDNPDGDVPAGSSDSELNDFPPEAYALHDNAPILLPTHVEAWVQTNPEPAIQPDLAPFLHGMPDPDQPESQPEVSIIWRYDNSKEALELVRPRSVEMLSVPLAAARQWLKKVDEFPISDMDAPSDSKEESESSTDKRRTGSYSDPLTHVMIWDPQQSSNVRQEKIKDLKAGDVLVIPPEFGGLTDGNWDPGASTHEDKEDESSNGADTKNIVEDLGDAAQWEYGKQCTLRLDSRLLQSFPFPLPTPPKPWEEEDSEIALKDRIKSWLKEAYESLDESNLSKRFTWLCETLKHLTSHSWSHSVVDPEGVEGSAYYVLRSGIDPDDNSWSETGTGTLLSEHLKGVGEISAEFADRLGLSEELTEDLRLAGELHDLGKVDPAFQMQMVGQDSIAYESTYKEKPLAKSLPGVNPPIDKWPDVRHEFSSVALIESSEEVLALANDRDLVLHLVSTHHGYGRPIPTIKRDSSPKELKFKHPYDGKQLSMTTSTDLVETTLAVDIAERFWRLHRRYGHHGIAWLEAIFRLADQRRSMLEGEI